MSADELTREQAWAEAKKLCAARWAWPKRHERAPLPMAIRAGEPKREVTWGQWWRLKFGNGESLQVYVERMRAARRTA